MRTLTLRHLFAFPSSRHGLLCRRCCSSSSRQDDPSFFITTPIFYVNAAPHIGHLYTSVIADAAGRYQALKNKRRPLLFSTGTDEHGMKIQKAAGGTDVLSHCDRVSGSFRSLADTFSIGYTDFVRTTEERHVKAVQAFWKVLEGKSHIYKSRYSGWYSVADEAFIPESNLEDQEGGKKVSKESGHPVEWTEEDNYLFRLSNLIPEVKDWIKNCNPIRPSKFQDIVLGWIEEGFEDLSISRPKSRLQWAIPVPGDESQVIYVWLDALVNYLTVAGYPDQMTAWPPTVQVVGKDILKFHAVYWPAFLIAAGLEPPRSLMTHSHWTVDGRKMSKSLGNVVDPFQLEKTYGADGIRYFLLREGTPHSDANFTEQKMLRLLNAELADTFGNLLSRCSGRAINPSQRWPRWDPETFDSLLSTHGVALKTSLESLPEKVESSYDEFNFYRGLEHIMTVARGANLYVQESQPWILAKKDPNDPVLLVMLSLVFETLRVTSILTSPVIPTLSSIVLDRLNVPSSECSWESLTNFLWNQEKETDEEGKLNDKSLGPEPSLFYKRVKL